MKKMVKITAVSAAVILAGFATMTGISKMTADSTVVSETTAEATEETTEAGAVNMDMKADIAAGIGRTTVQSVQTKTEDTTEDNADVADGVNNTDMEQPVTVVAQTNNKTSASTTGNSTQSNATTPVTSPAPTTINNKPAPVVPATTEAPVVQACQHDWKTVVDEEAYDEPVYEEKVVGGKYASVWSDGTMDEVKMETGDRITWCMKHCVTCFPDCPDPDPRGWCAIYNNFSIVVPIYETVQVDTIHHDAVTHEECSKCGAKK